MSALQEFVINANELHGYRGALMARLKRDVSWQEMAALAGVSSNTLSGIVNGRSTGSAETAMKLVQMLNSQGVPATYEQLLARA